MMRTSMISAAFRGASRSAFRELFPVTRKLIYFNHAAVGPLSIRACEAMERHARDQRDHGALHWRDWYAEYDRARESAAKLIGAQPGEIAILKNTSEGISFVAEGLRWREGDNVITTAFEFTSNWSPWKRLERRGVECRVATLPAADEIAKLIDDRTRVVTVSSVAFHNGFTADLDAIGALCASRGIRFFVDAIQSVGVLPMDVRKSKIDFLAADGHKWLCSTEGAAIFYVASERRDELEVLESGWTNVDRKGKFILSDTDLLPDARRFEAGSLNTNGVYALRAALDLVHEIGIDVIRDHALNAANALAEGLRSIGWEAGQPGNRATASSPIVRATPPSVDKSIRWYHGKLEEKGIVTAPREGLLRFSPHYYNDEDEVARVIDALRGLSSSS
jgi:selenocysteine lyase/cysteine desulfurase